MKQAKKMLCMLLVMLLAFSTVSIGVNAAYTSYASPSGQTLHEKPLYTTAQRGSQLLDFVDEMLRELDFNEDYVVIKLNLTSVDAALDTVSSLKSAAGAVGGDVKKLDFDAVPTTRRGTSGKTDLNILYELLYFLKANKSIVAKFVKGDLDLGIIGSFVELDLNVHNLLADMLYEMCVDESYDPDNGTIDYNTWTVDKILAHAIEVLLGGGVAADGDVVEGFMPSLKGKINLNSQTMWQIIELAANAATKDILLPFIKNDLGALLEEAKATTPEEVKEVWELIDLSKLNLDNYVWCQYDAKNGIVAELNHFLYTVINQVWTGEKFWVDGGNDKLEENLASAIKIVYEKFGTLVLPASAEFLPQDEINAMNFQQLVSYIAVQFLRAEMPYLLWDTADASVTIPTDSLENIACTVAYSILAELPLNSAVYMEQYEFGNIEWNKDTALKMVADIGVYYLEGALPIDLNYGEGVDALMTKLVNWALANNNFGGFFAGCGVSASDSPWQKIDKTVFAVLPLHQILGGGATGSYDLIMNKLLDNVLNLNLEGILSLLYKTDSGLLNNPAPVFVVNILNRVLNVIVARNTQPAIFNPNPPSIDSLVQNNNLATSAEKLLEGLYAAGQYEYFWSSLLPILNPLLIDESGYACNQKPAGSGYVPTTTREALKAYVESIDEAMDEPDDVYNTDVSAWNESEDYVLWRYDQLEDAVDEAWDVVNGYEDAVEWVAEANERLAAANASGNADEITAAQENLADAQAELASYTADKYNQAGKNLSYYVEKTVNNTELANQGDLQYIIYIIEYNDEKIEQFVEENYPEDVWANYQEALDHAYALIDMDAEAGEVKQSMLNAARRNLMDAMRLLEIDLADLTALIAKLAEAKLANTDGKTEDSVARLNALIERAEEYAAGSWTIDEQNAIDELVEDLQAAIDGLEDYVAPIVPELVEKAEEIKTAFSNGVELIYNFATQLTVEALKSDYIDSDENGTLEVVKANKYGAYVGTGSELILRDKKGTEIARHTVVIFGDANGDGIIDVIDTILLDLQQAGDGDIANNSAAWHALNVGGNDKVIDAKDVLKLDAYANFEGELDQSAIVI